MVKEPIHHSEFGKTLHLSEVREGELLSVLHEFFEYKTIPLSSSMRRFGEESEGPYLDIEFKDDGTISTIQGHLTEAHKAALSAHISSILIENQKQVVGQGLCFSAYHRVAGFYRYKDFFQILPIPADAPHAPMLMAPHPFILQFKYSSCPNSSINGYRRIEKTAKLARILNSLSTNPISVHPKYTRHFWGIFKNGEISVRLVQQAYWYPGFVPELADFSFSNQMPPIKLFPTAEYYDPSFFSEDYEQVFPDLIGQYLDKVLSLIPEDSERFTLASAWFAQVAEMWPASRSAALIAVVSAIEALLDHKYEICSECKQAKYGVTKTFKSFLQEYVPGVQRDFPKEYKTLYTVRSNLAHGKDLLESDREYWNYFGNPLEQSQSDFQRNTHLITATALRNWVLSR